MTQSPHVVGVGSHRCFKPLPIGGIQIAIKETLEHSFCAELVEPSQHGVAFGGLAVIDGAGDFLSSAVVGLLLSVWGPILAFGYSATLFTLGA